MSSDPSDFVEKTMKNAIHTLRKNPGVAGAAKDISEMTLAEVEAFEKSIGLMPSWGETYARRLELLRRRATGGEDKGWA